MTLNQCFQMVYKDVLQRGTNIIQLLLNNVGYQQPREMLPFQDLFENITAFHGKLLFTPDVDASLEPTTRCSRPRT